MKTDSDAVAALIRGRIQAGREPPDQRTPDALPAQAELPSLTALAEYHGVGRGVVERAFETLKAEGLILTHRGRKARVADYRPAQVIRWDRYRRRQREDPTGLTTYHRQVEDSGWRGRVEYIDVSMVPCPNELLYAEPDGTKTWLASLLGCNVGDQVARRQRLRWAAPLRTPTNTERRAHEAAARRAGRAPTPLASVPDLVLERVAELFTSYIPGWVVEAVERGAPLGGPTILTRGACGVGGSYSRIERDGGLIIDWIEERILMRPPSDEEAELLASNGSGLILEMVRRVESRGRVVTVDRCVHPLTTQVQFVFGYLHTD